MTQGNRLEDGIVAEFMDERGEVVKDERMLSWFDQGAPCVGCAGTRAEARTIIDRELILLAGDTAAQARYIEVEREQSRRRLSAMGDLCPGCAKAPPHG